MTISENILKTFESKDINLDDSQLDFIEVFDNNKPNRGGLFFTSSKSIIKGFYLWGDVGRGKTLLLNSIFDELQFKKGKFHYIDFMEFIHNKLKELAGKKNPLDYVADFLDSKYEIIYIDEFQVEDVADAMLITNLFKKLFKKDIYFLLSSNAHPSNLYLDGLQREKFLIAIDLLLKNLNVYELEGKNDYRLSMISNFERNNNETIFNKKQIKDFISATFSCEEFKQKIIVNKRTFSCNGFNNSYLWVSFKNFFSEPSGSKDYIEIVNKYDWLLIDGFIECDDDHAAILRRFISFIDIAYKENSKVKFFNDGIDAENIYTGDNFQYLWDRSQSRIKEMKSKKYLLNSAKK